MLGCGIRVFFPFLHLYIYSENTLLTLEKKKKTRFAFGGTFVFSHKFFFYIITRFMGVFWYFSYWIFIFLFKKVVGACSLRANGKVALAPLIWATCMMSFSGQIWHFVVSLEVPRCSFSHGVTHDGQIIAGGHFPPFFSLSYKMKWTIVLFVFYFSVSVLILLIFYFVLILFIKFCLFSM